MTPKPTTLRRWLLGSTLLRAALHALILLARSSPTAERQTLEAWLNASESATPVAADTYRLEYGGASGAPLPLGASAALLRRSLLVLPAVGAVAVDMLAEPTAASLAAGRTAHGYVIEFSAASAGGAGSSAHDLPLLGCDAGPGSRAACSVAPERDGKANSLAFTQLVRNLLGALACAGGAAAIAGGSARLLLAFEVYLALCMADTLVYALDGMISIESDFCAGAEAGCVDKTSSVGLPAAATLQLLQALHLFYTHKFKRALAPGAVSPAAVEMYGT